MIQKHELFPISQSKINSNSKMIQTQIGNPI